MTNTTKMTEELKTSIEKYMNVQLRFAEDNLKRYTYHPDAYIGRLQGYLRCLTDMHLITYEEREDMNDIFQNQLIALEKKYGKR